MVPPQDPHALAAAIEYLNANPEVMRRFGQTARKRLLELFTLEGMANAVEAEYHDLVVLCLPRTGERASGTYYYKPWQPPYL